MKKYFFLLLCIASIRIFLNISECYAQIPNNLPGEYVERKLKECTVSSEILKLTEGFVDRYKNELSKENTIIYLSFRGKYNPEMYIFSYSDDSVFYNTYLVNDDTIVGYFRYKNYYCILEQRGTEQYLKGMYKFTGKNHVFSGQIFSIGAWPDEPSVSQNYIYENGEFSRVKYYDYNY